MSQAPTSPSGLPEDPVAREELIRSHLRKARERVESARRSPSPDPGLRNHERLHGQPSSLASPLQSQFHHPMLASQHHQQQHPDRQGGAQEDDENGSRSHSPDLSYYQRSPPVRYLPSHQPNSPQYQYRPPPPPQQQHYRPDPRLRGPPPPAQWRGPRGPGPSSLAPPPHSRPMHPQQNQRFPVRVPPRAHAPYPPMSPPPHRRPVVSPDHLAQPSRENSSSTHPTSAHAATGMNQDTYFDKPTSPGQPEVPGTPGSTYATPREWPTQPYANLDSAVYEPTTARGPLPSPSSTRPNEYSSPSAGPFPFSGSIHTSDSGSDVSKDENNFGENYANAEGGLVREASIGRRGKPALTYTRRQPSEDQQGPRPQTPDAATLISAALGASLVTPASSGRSPDVSPGGVFKSDTALVGPGSSAENLSMLQRERPTDHSELHDSRNGVVDEKFGYSEHAGRKSGTLLAVPEDVAAAARPDSKRISTRASFRPSYKSADSGVRDSTTSLPSLIKRALRLASTMEQNRTQSRWGTDWMGGSSNTHTDTSSSNKRRSAGSLNTILNAFPLTPTGGSPQSQYGERPVNQWPQSQLRHMEHMSATPAEPDLNVMSKSRRRCCGMPLWLFILVVLLVICLVAAAVAIPIALIVVPRQNSPAAGRAPSLAQCAASTVCANGGSNFVTADGTCSCVCASGFVGTNCEQPDNSEGCTTIAVDSNGNATIGAALPTLITVADADYGIPINASALLALFSLSSLSCSSQNALVTLNGAATSKSSLLSRQIAATNASSASTLNFARTGILYIYQVERSLDAAIEAQSGLQSYFLQPSMGDASNVTLSGGWLANLVKQTLQKGSTTIGEDR